MSNMNTGQVKNIIISEIKDHLPYQQLNSAAQIALQNHLVRILEGYEKEILNDRKAVLEWVLRNI